MAEQIPEKTCWRCGEKMMFHVGYDVFICHDRCHNIQCWMNHKYGSCNHPECLKYGRQKNKMLPRNPERIL